MKFALKDAVVVITGASSGIGQATAEAFARQGCRLVLAARNGDALERVAQSCRQSGVEVAVITADVTDIASVTAVGETALEFGTVDIWVSNAGVGAVGRFEETPMEAHEQVIRTNLIGHINDAYVAVPIFLRQGRGTFINMISLGGFAAAPFASAYSASKFGLRGFAEALRAELADKPNIHICDVYPAFVDTPGLYHGANYVGREIKAPPPLLDARRVAAAIVDIARSPRPSTLVGSVSIATRLAHILAPNLIARTLGRFAEMYFRRARRMQRSEGNLYAPSSDAPRIDGGLRSPHRQSAYVLAAAAIIGAAAGVMVAQKRWNSVGSVRHALPRKGLHRY
jgi:short-subunit dehydrogenase